LREIIIKPETVGALINGIGMCDAKSIRNLCFIF